MQRISLPVMVAAVNSMLVEVAVVMVVAATAKHWGHGCPLLFQWGLATFLVGVGFFTGAFILERSENRQPKVRLPMIQRQRIGASTLAMLALLFSSALLFGSFFI